jgi:hypothetical protein
MGLLDDRTPKKLHIMKHHVQKTAKSLKQNYERVIVVVLIVSILSLVYYLKGPLTERFFTKDPSSYYLSNFKQDYRYRIYQGDYLLGKKALPNSKIKVLITPGKYSFTAKADSKGEFVFRLPEEAKLGKFRVTFANFDALKNLAWIRSYKVTIDSNNTISQLPILKNFQPKDAQAEEGIED